MDSNINYCFASIAVNDKYVDLLVNLIKDIREYSNVPFFVFTDNEKPFASIPYVYTKLYEEEIFSYHDKRKVLQYALERYNTAILIDADNKLNKDKVEFPIRIDLKEGIYPQIIWRHPAECSIENFLEGKTDRVPYGKEFKQYCDKHNIITDGAELIQESFIIFVKKEHPHNQFFNIWEKLAIFCNTKDNERNQNPLGYGEGYSIGISAKNSGYKVDCNNPILKIQDNFLHIAWHPHLQ